MIETPKKSIWKRWWFWLIIALIAIGILASCGIKNDKPTSVLDTTLTSEEEQELVYIQSVLRISENLTEALTYIGDLVSAKPYFALWTEKEIINVTLYTMVIEQSYEEAKEIEPPEKFEVVYSLTLSGWSKYAEAMPILREGLSSSNVNKMNQAASLLGEGTEFINQATKELKKIN